MKTKGPSPFFKNILEGKTGDVEAARRDLDEFHRAKPAITEKTWGRGLVDGNKSTYTVLVESIANEPCETLLDLACALTRVRCAAVERRSRRLLTVLTFGGKKN